MAKSCDLSERAILRLIGSVKVPRKVPLSLVSGQLTYGAGPQDPGEEIGGEGASDLGLRLDRVFQVGIGPETLRALVAALLEYKKCCPTVVSWVGRGDFRPRDVPQNIGRAVLLHASRTAGRLRARLMRGRSENIGEVPPEDCMH